MNIDNLSVEELLELKKQISEKLSKDGCNKYLKGDIGIRERFYRFFTKDVNKDNATKIGMAFNNLNPRVERAVLFLTDVAFCNYRINVMKDKVRCDCKKYIPFENKDEYIQMAHEIMDVLEKHYKGFSKEIND